MNETEIIEFLNTYLRALHDDYVNSETQKFRAAAAINGYYLETPLMNDVVLRNQKEILRISGEVHNSYVDAEVLLAYFECGHGELDDEISISSFIDLAVSILIKPFVGELSMDMDGAGWKKLDSLIRNDLETAKKTEFNSSFDIFSEFTGRIYLNSKIKDTIKSSVEFENVEFDTSIKKNINFNSKISKDKLIQIYERLIDKSILKDTVTEEDFVLVLTEDWGAHNSNIFFSVPNNLINTTITYLGVHFERLNIASASRSGHFYNQRGNIINAASISSYGSSHETPYEQELIIKDCIKA